MATGVSDKLWSTPDIAQHKKAALSAMREVGRDIRLQVMLTDDELAAINEYQFSTRLGSRAEAVRELIRLGLATHRDRVAKNSN